MDAKNFYKLITLNLITSANCTIAQIALSVGLSYIFSSSIFVFSFFTGLYLMSMGLGTVFVEKFDFDSRKFVQIILINSILGVILANPGITGLLFANEYFYYLLRNGAIDLTVWLFGLGMILTVCIGIVSGAELPIFSKYIESKQWHVSKPIIGVLTSDYFGAFLGILVFTLFLNPFIGLIQSIIAAQIITLLYINYIYFLTKTIGKSGKITSLLLLLNIYILLCFIFRSKIITLLDSISGF